MLERIERHSGELRELAVTAAKALAVTEAGKNALAGREGC
jgi:hypothetical protein